MAEASEHQMEHYAEVQERLERISASLGLDKDDPEVQEVAEYLSDNEEDVVVDEEPEIDVRLLTVRSPSLSSLSALVV